MRLIKHVNSIYKVTHPEQKTAPALVLTGRLADSNSVRVDGGLFDQVPLECGRVLSYLDTGIVDPRQKRRRADTRFPIA